MEDIKVIKLSKEELADSISGLTQLKPVLKTALIKLNGKNIAQGIKDSKEIGQHLDTAINAMITVLGYMEEKE